MIRPLMLPQLSFNLGFLNSSVLTHFEVEACANFHLSVESLKAAVEESWDSMSWLTSRSPSLSSATESRLSQILEAASWRNKKNMSDLIQIKVVHSPSFNPGSSD